MATDVLRLHLNRPDKRNALTDSMVAAMIDSIDAAGRDETVRVIVISGEGDHFCSGFDIVSRNADDGTRPRVGSIQRRLPSQAHRLIPLILNTQTPVVCRVQGGVRESAHLALAATRRRHRRRALRMPFVDRGFLPTAAPRGCCRVASASAPRHSVAAGLSSVRAASWGCSTVSFPPPPTSTWTTSCPARSERYGRRWPHNGPL